ncbi:MAG: hypothetical protein GX847_03830 [Clostridiales bacterium]|nr:hypothetical protein [Clostridiales bacterium]
MIVKSVQNKSHKSRRNSYISILIGVILVAFGVLGVLLEMVQSFHLVMLLGMFTGIGAVFIGGGVFTLYRVRFAPQKLKEEEINRRDERNIQVTRASYAVSNSAAALLFGFMAFILVLLNYITPALIAVGALCIQALVSVIAYRVFNKRM